MKNLNFILDTIQRAGLEVIITGSVALYALGHSQEQPNDLDLLVTKEDSDGVAFNLMVMGFTKTPYGSERPIGFHLWRQYKKGDLKIDLFLVEKAFCDYQKKGDYLYANPGIIWAARGFYAVTSFKQVDQLAKIGYYYGVVELQEEIAKENSSATYASGYTTVSTPRAVESPIKKSWLRRFLRL